MNRTEPNPWLLNGPTSHMHAKKLAHSMKSKVEKKKKKVEIE